MADQIGFCCGPVTQHNKMGIKNEKPISSAIFAKPQFLIRGIYLLCFSCDLVNVTVTHRFKVAESDGHISLNSKWID